MATSEPVMEDSSSQGTEKPASPVVNSSVGRQLVAAEPRLLGRRTLVPDERSKFRKGSRGRQPARWRNVANTRFSKRPPRNSDGLNRAVRRRIAAGQRTLARIRFRLSGFMLLLGVVASVLYECVYSIRLSEDLGFVCHNDMRSHIDALLDNLLFYARFAIFSMAPLANDIRLTRLVLTIDSGILILSYWQFLPAMLNEPAFGVQLATAVSGIVLMVIFVCGAARAVLCTKAAEMQRRMWMTLSIWIILTIPTNAAVAFAGSWRCRMISSQWWSIPSAFLTLYFVQQPRFRQAIRARLNRMLVANSAERTAASIAGMVGDFTAREAQSQAAARFRHIYLNEIKFEDIESNKPSPDLYSRSSSAKLQDCDAFISHSCKDDPTAKWAALQRWRADFVRQHGQEPKVWFDKACIDQNNIDANLRCLPIFLSGCESLLVLCGPTTMSRLWCVMELFTFIYVGGFPENVIFAPVVENGSNQNDWDAIDVACTTFDARTCDCFHAEDKERILEIVEPAFGDLSIFNDVLQSIFEAVGWCNSADGWPLLREDGIASVSAISCIEEGDDESEQIEREHEIRV